ncbi:MAG: TIGR04283 family arsenosugar biosynthesis glycosyltransferase [Acidiferrobacter sp.]
MYSASMLVIVMPVRNEEAGIMTQLQVLQTLRERGAEVVMVDGGSQDHTVRLATPWVDQLLHSVPGRARQMNAGARASKRPLLLFLHADTRLPSDADQQICDGLAHSGRYWGRFDVRIDSTRPTLCVVAAMMNLRSRLTGICTGDQALFVSRAAFEAAGGFSTLPLMEDIDLSRRLKRLSWPLCLRARVVTSARRWERCGVWRTIMLMWWLRLLYWVGTSPDRLARIYTTRR